MAGDEVHLAGARVGTVTRDRVTLGPGCEAGTLRASTREVHPDATVEEVVDPREA